MITLEVSSSSRFGCEKMVVELDSPNFHDDDVMVFLGPRRGARRRADGRFKLLNHLPPSQSSSSPPT
eukprot:scaffold798_cov162-Amphora_coffeaeformis.AAC.16